MVCLESWTFEIMVLLSGAFPNAKLETSVLSICLNTSGILWMVPFGVSDAGRYCQRMRLAETWCNCQSRIFLFYRRSFFCCDSFCPPYERTGAIFRDSTGNYHSNVVFSCDHPTCQLGGRSK
ncbi:uncharacterized protein LOC109800796 isoform X1 [Cajanus cajan]|uniref:uncharacterized protein LOC109800796 isoform X1 n=1 Tax=Cajanus cajan TaxID=3821 RepID=UPI00098D8A1B|nr:uncharacterized protein LOC109800796 isoform X1 [Cajanus cajan]